MRDRTAGSAQSRWPRPRTERPPARKDNGPGALPARGNSGAGTCLLSAAPSGVNNGRQLSAVTLLRRRGDLPTAASAPVNTPEATFTPLRTYPGEGTLDLADLTNDANEIRTRDLFAKSHRPVLSAGVHQQRVSISFSRDRRPSVELALRPFCFC